MRGGECLGGGSRACWGGSLVNKLSTASTNQTFATSKSQDRSSTPHSETTERLTRNSSYISPYSRHAYPGIPSGSRGLLAGLAVPWLCARWLGFWRARLLVPRSGGSRCGRGCRCLCRWTGRRAFRRTCSFGVRLWVVVRSGVGDLVCGRGWDGDSRKVSFFPFA